MNISHCFTCVLIAAVAFVSGCDNQDATKVDGKKAAPGTHVHADGSVHSDDHSHHGEGHTHAPGPHGGTIADWGGGKYHVEFTVDHDKQQATAYVFGTDEKTPVPIDAEEISLTIKDPWITISLAASPLDGEVIGGASRFVGTHEGLGVVQEYEGSVSGVIDETPYTGSFKEEADDH